MSAVAELVGIWRKGVKELQTGVSDSPSHDLKRLINERAEAFQICIGELEAAIKRDEVASPAPRWQPIETAPKDGPFLVHHNGAAGPRTMVADGRMLLLSRLRDTPEHLSGHHWTHWMPLPAPPQEKP